MAINAAALEEVEEGGGGEDGIGDRLIRLIGNQTSNQEPREFNRNCNLSPGEGEGTEGDAVVSDEIKVVATHAPPPFRQSIGLLLKLGSFLH